MSAPEKHDNTVQYLDNGAARSAKTVSILDFGGGVCNILAITAMTILVFQHNWNLWLIGVGVLAIIGIAWSASVESEFIGGTGFLLGIACFLMMAGYGLSKIDLDGRTISHPVVLACGTDTEQDEEGNSHAILRTPQGSFNIEPGEYYILKDGERHKIFAATAEEAAALFMSGHAYRLTVDNYLGESYDGITTAREVPNTLGACTG